jgi:putative hemolysin
MMAMIRTTTSTLTVGIAQTSDDVTQVLRLRYRIFVEELGGDGPLVDHRNRLERDRFDDHATHLLLRDLSLPKETQVVGVYRLLTTDGAQAAGQFYCEDEYDLSLLKHSGKRLLELGRSCLHPDYRGGVGMMHLWRALSDFVTENNIDIIFGVASFHGTDLTALAAPLSLLHHRHLAPPALRVTAQGATAQPMDLVQVDAIDRIAALRSTPALIKAYLRLGGMVGEGAFIDHAFNTTDICMILPTDDISTSQRNIYAKGKRSGG